MFFLGRFKDRTRTGTDYIVTERERDRQTGREKLIMMMNEGASSNNNNNEL